MLLKAPRKTMIFASKKLNSNLKKKSQKNPINKEPILNKKELIELKSTFNPFITHSLISNTKQNLVKSINLESKLAKTIKKQDKTVK